VDFILTEITANDPNGQPITLVPGSARVTIGAVQPVISGYVRTADGSGIEGVVMNGLPGSPSTDSKGYYSATVSYGWSGTVTPTKTGYTFSPTSRSYSNVTGNLSDQNYTAQPLTTQLTISGYVRAADGSGIEGVTMRGLPGSPSTDSKGYYSAKVSYGWGGTVAPEKSGYKFTPESRSYSNVTGDLSDQNYTGSVAVTSGIPITPVVSASQVAGEEFWVEIRVGDKDKAVKDLFGVSFVLNFDTTYVDVVSVIAGDFLGADLVFYPHVEEDKGKVSVGISRKSGAGGVSGSGVVAKVKFKSLPETPSGTKVEFRLTEITANDPNGQPIVLVPGSAMVTIEGVLVWPGDTNNDGVVNIADVLPIGLHWGRKGPARANPSMSWVGQPVQPWDPPNAAYADANGDGVVNQADILPIGLNWGKTHPTPSRALMVRRGGGSAVLSPIISRHKGGWMVEVKASGVEDLFGVSFELCYTKKDVIDSVYVEPGDFMGSDVVFLSKEGEGKVSVGVTRKAGQGGVNGDGIVARVFLMESSKADEIGVMLKEIMANDSVGNPIYLDAAPAGFRVGKGGDTLDVGGGFMVSQNFPNPFNGRTVIWYRLAKPSHVRVVVYNSLGQRIRVLVNEMRDAGCYTAVWDGRDDAGREVASGVYLYRIKVGGYEETKKMILRR
jgi:hypothetical protein